MTRQDKDDDDDCNDTQNGTNTTKAKAQLRQEFDILQQEMEVAGYAKGPSGQLRRVVPRKESLIRTRKRRLLEQQDAQELALHQDKGEETRLRGSKAAIEDHIVQGSLIFPETTIPTAAVAAEDTTTENLDMILEDDESDEEVENENDEDDEAFEEENDDEDTSPGIVPEVPLDPNSKDGGGEEAANTKLPSKTNPAATKKQRRRMYRLRNFQSFRMAQQHGDALGAHARGDQKLAIEKLKEVAKNAPSAPQVYSSLGMVYEDMLKESRKKQQKHKENSLTELESQPAEDTTTNTTTINERLPDPNLAEQLDLAKKAYGSYHVAAILCKKDFTLWVRGADSATEIAEIHGSAMTLPHISPELREYHRSERKRWLSEALRDFKVADNLKPPGIDVPAKLASMHMEMGNLSEALTILTDLKNRHAEEGSRNEFQSSYKTWLLYSDLMLRIGHECIQWNRGIHTNDNYMFRRWLRKLSTVFDWQERRLQALSLALEAAAGTKCTDHFMSWMRERSIPKKPESADPVEKERWHSNLNDGIIDQYKEQSTTGKEIDQTQPEGVSNQGTTSPQSQEKSEQIDGQALESKKSSEATAVDAKDEESSEQLEAEKQLLIGKNRSELEAYDKTTFDMSLDPESIPAKNREANRTVLLHSHEAAIAALIGEYNQDTSAKPIQVATALEEEERMIVHQQKPLSISASCRQVCAIASDLIKHLHGLELYTGARLAGEAVSSYLKERANISDRRRASRKRREEWQQKLARSPFIFEPYVEANDEAASSDDEASPYLSDEEGIDNSEDLELLDSMRKGALPPEIKVLVGLALIGEGGRNYVAAKCIESIEDLEQESSLWFSEGDLETQMAEDPLWHLFRRAMTEPLGRTAAYAFLADVLQKTKKEQEWIAHFPPMFRRHLDTLKSVGLMNELMRLREDITPYTNFRKNQLLKVILAACRFDIDAVESPAKQNPINRQLIVTDDISRLNMAMDAIKSLTSVIHLTWKVENDGSLPSISTEVIRVSRRYLKWFSREPRDKVSYSCLKEVITQSRTLLSFLCGEDIPELGSEEQTEWSSLGEDSGFPIKTSWQPAAYRPLSLRVYNLIVACNVALFSGWEPEEFTLRLLRRRHGNKHFGVHFHDKRVTGIVPAAIEEEIGRQWAELVIFLPHFSEINFSDRLAKVKQLDWYKEEIENRKETVRDAPIARYGEEDGIALCLAYSSLCLKLAGLENEGESRNRLLKICLSTILPISQFCLDDSLWDSDIGEAASTLSGFDEWRLMAGVGRDSVIVPSEKGKRPSHRKKSEKAIEKKVQEWIKGTGKPTIQSFVGLPTRELSRLWHAEDTPAIDKDWKEASRMSMERVHKSTQQLRACYTEMAIEKASLQVATSLVELASQPGCHNPFLCLQQAAMFASQASKAGNSDMAFRQGLPEITKCTPREALNAIGRADCLHSVYFPNEAAYLCSYVAKVCRLHRDREQPEYEWNGQWKVVAIYAFNVSVMIRTTVSTVLDETMQKSFLSMWERDVVEELERGRSDGLSWKRALSPHVHFSMDNRDDDDDDDEDECIVDQDDDVDEGASDAEDGDDDDERNGKKSGSEPPLNKIENDAHGDEAMDLSLPLNEDMASFGASFPSNQVGFDGHVNYLDFATGSKEISPENNNDEDMGITLYQI